MAGQDRVDPDLFTEWRSGAYSFVEYLYSLNHSHYKVLAADCKTPYISDTRACMGVLKAIRAEIDAGFIGNIEQLVAADIFSNFFDMAAHLIEQGYKDPAASLIGAVLENGLFKIGTLKKVTVKVRDDLNTLNQKLAEANVYNRLAFKEVQAWTALRNHADHGEFDQYTADQVKDMLSGCRRLLGQHL